MEQDQFKISFSLRAKLLLSVVVLIIIVIGFLNYSSYVLFRDDKVAYVYETQAKEAVLAGKEFVNITNRVIDSLRQSLSLIDLQSQGERRKGSLKAVIDNQSQIAGLKIHWISVGDSKITEASSVANEVLLARTSLQASDLTIIDSWLLSIPKSSEATPLTFFNLSRVGSVPMIAIALADTSTGKNGKPLLVATAFVPLDQFLKEIQAGSLSVLNGAGWLLYSSDPALALKQTDFSQHPLFIAARQNQLDRGALEYGVENLSYLGSYFKPGFDLIAISETTVDAAMRATYALSTKFILLGVMAIGGAVIFAIFFAKTLTAPLNQLYDATKAVSAGNFDLDLKASSQDEIGALSKSFNTMSKKIVGLIEESMEKVRLEGELAIASTVQQTLIPPEKIREDGMSIVSHYESASECGGDWWGYFLHGSRAAIFIADATGHGIPSALITASARSCFSVLHKLALEDSNFQFTPRNMLSFANRAIYDSASGKIMMTFFAGVIDFDNMTLTYASAGHNPPWLFRKSEQGYKLNSLTARGCRLGESPDLGDLEELTTAFGGDDILFLYTDGITEGKSPTGEMFGKKRVRKILEASLNGGPELMIQNLVRDFKAHNQDKPLDDDITLVATQFKNREV